MIRMDFWVDGALILVVALLVDRYVGDPSNRYHPLRWMGNLLDAVDRRVSNRKSWSATLIGFLSYLLVFVVFGGVALTVTMAVRYALSGVTPFDVLGQHSDLGEVLWIVVSGYLLKMTFALFAFSRFCRPIQEDLRRGDTEAAAAKTQMMVNRKTSGMDEAHITSSCCETVSENLVDSVVSPLFYFGILGLPGAVMLRCANLMDAMWGRRTEKYNMIGHFPARWDDVLGFVPSRLAPFFVGLAAWIMRIKGRRPAVRAAVREHRKTPSPNSGWPMTATSAAMGLSFEKEGVYVMGEGPLPSIDDVMRCCRLIELTSVLFALIVVFPLASCLGVHVQILVEDFLHSLLWVFR